jgi:hypothetical protein
MRGADTMLEGAGLRMLLIEDMELDKALSRLSQV